MILFLLFITFLVESLPSCLHLRSNCIRDPVCSNFFLSFEKTCGYALTRCTSASPSDCVRDLRAIRDHLGSSTCVCYRVVGFEEDCDYFRQLIWNHPCERLIEDAGQERALAERESVTAISIREKTTRRYTRTPVADRVHQQLNGDLHTKSRLESGTCNEALDQVCMRHVSCRQLWRLFRSSCGVDQDNKCTMTDPEVCWQSFEGLSWTGLGNCHCDTTNPDCHWIRLLTNYNKCIYEISLTKTGTYLQERTADDYRRRFETAYAEQQRQGSMRRQQERYQQTNNDRSPYQQERRGGQEDRSRGLPVEQQSETVSSRPDERRTDEESRSGQDVRRPADDQRQTDQPTRLTEGGQDNRRLEQQTVQSSGTSVRDGQENGRNEYHRRTDQGSGHIMERIRQGRPEQSIDEDSQRNRVWNVGHYQPVSTTTTTTSTTTTTTTTTTPRPRIAVTQRPPPSRSGLRATVKERPEEKTYYRPLLTGQPTPRPGYYRYSTSPPRRGEVATTMSNEPEPITSAQPTQLTPTRLLTRASFTRSTCPEAVGRCEAADDCRWHLGELKARCSRTSCRRDDCASALQRFSRYVPQNHAESVMFCQCSPSDQGCHSVQELFYPQCLYVSSTIIPTCSQTATRCDSDVRCRALRDQLLASCPLSNGECVGRSLSDCRRVLLAARGSILEQPCFCPLNDVSCIREQRQIIPSHPCIEKAMRDLSSAEPVTTALIPRDSFYPKEEEKTKETVKEQHRNKHRGRTNSTTTTTTTTPEPTTLSAKGSGRLRHKTTVIPPPPTEAPPPWETTTTELVTTTEEYMTAPAPPAEGCNARDANGRTVFFPMGTVMRRYVDWSSRCSSWCECIAVEQLSCERLPCLEDGVCEAPLTNIEYGERIYLKGRGACFCETGQFICELPEEMPEIYPGLYVTAGYSVQDLEMLRKEVPSLILDKAGLMSADVAKDIGSRLQMALERLQPETLQCRLVLLPELSEPGAAFFQVEWFGLDERFNHTRTQWQHDGSEKICSSSVTRLADLFSNSDSIRYQLILSTVKQIKVLDYLDGIPSSTSVALLPVFFLLFRLV